MEKEMIEPMGAHQKRAERVLASLGFKEHPFSLSNKLINKRIVSMFREEPTYRIDVMEGYSYVLIDVYDRTGPYHKGTMTPTFTNAIAICRRYITKLELGVKVKDL